MSPTPHFWPKQAVVEVETVGALLTYLAEGKLDRYTMVWRGVADIGWALDSSLFRKLSSTVARSAVDENVMAGAEQELLREARRLRFDRSQQGARLTTLELLATL